MNKTFILKNEKIKNLRYYINIMITRYQKKIIIKKEKYEEESDDENDNEEYNDDEYEEEYEEEYENEEEEKNILLTAKNMTSEKLEEYNKKFKTIIEKMEKTEPTLEKILDSNLSENKKIKILEWYMQIYENNNINPIDKLEYKRKINDILEKDNEKKEEKQRLKKIKENIQVKRTDKLYEIKKKILGSEMSDYNKTAVYTKYKYMKTLNESSEDYQKINEWINIALSLPISRYTFESVREQNLKEKLEELRKKLETEMYGMTKIKDEILRFVCNKFAGINTNKGLLTLIGPAGVGKTQLIKTVAKILEIPFEIIPLGGMADVSYLDGHSYTYIGSIPGMIVQKLIKLGCKNGIIYFDEIDKLAEIGTKSSEIQSLLLHTLDSVQNKEFQDKYLSGLKIDLSEVWFILSGNDETKINPILENRLYIVKLSGYSNDEKIKIIKNYFIPDNIKKYKLDNYIIIENDNIYSYIINKINNIYKEDGVRKCEFYIETLINKIFLKKIIGEFKEKYILNEKCVDDLLKEYEQKNNINHLLYL